MDDRGWKHAAMEFGEAIKPLCGLLDALETGINVDNYPRVMYEAGRQKEDATQQMEEESAQPERGQQLNEGGGEGPSRGRGGDVAREARRGQERQATEGGYMKRMKGRTKGNIRSRRSQDGRTRMRRDMGDGTQLTT